MEDVFQIIIWLFIIISFLSSFFKKKGTPPPPAKQTERKQREEQQSIQNQGSRQSEPQEEYDILKEIEGLFNQQKAKPTRYEEYDENNNIPETEYRVKSEKSKLGDVVETWKHPSSSEQSIENQWDARRRKMEERKTRIDSSVHRKAEKFEKLLQKKAAPADEESGNSIAGKIKNPDNLREYIIFSEILKKPKSMRR
jgi:hypothetical protein